MKLIVCIIDNHTHLEYGKTYELIAEKDGKCKISRIVQGTAFSEIYWWDKSFFVSLEDFRNEKINNLLQ
jgi:hypothetical protein